MAAQSTDLTGSDQTVTASSTVTYFGFTAYSAAGGRFVVHETSLTGPILDEVNLAAGESAREWYGPQGILAHDGIYVDIISGTISGAIRHG